MRESTVSMKPRKMVIHDRDKFVLLWTFARSELLVHRKRFLYGIALFYLPCLHHSPCDFYITLKCQEKTRNWPFQKFNGIMHDLSYSEKMTSRKKTLKPMASWFYLSCRDKSKTTEVGVKSRVVCLLVWNSSSPPWHLLLLIQLNRFEARRDSETGIYIYKVLLWLVTFISLGLNWEE